MSINRQRPGGRHTGNCAGLPALTKVVAKDACFTLQCCRSQNKPHIFGSHAARFSKPEWAETISRAVITPAQRDHLSLLTHILDPNKYLQSVTFAPTAESQPIDIGTLPGLIEAES